MEVDLSAHEIGAFGLNLQRLRFFGRYAFDEDGQGFSIGLNLSFWKALARPWAERPRKLLWNPGASAESRVKRRGLGHSCPMPPEGQCRPAPLLVFAGTREFNSGNYASGVVSLTRS